MNDLTEDEKLLVLLRLGGGGGGIKDEEEMCGGSSARADIADAGREISGTCGLFSDTGYGSGVWRNPSTVGGVPP